MTGNKELLVECIEYERPLGLVAWGPGGKTQEETEGFRESETGRMGLKNATCKSWEDPCDFQKYCGDTLSQKNRRREGWDRGRGRRQRELGSWLSW